VSRRESQRGGRISLLGRVCGRVRVADGVPGAPEHTSWAHPCPPAVPPPATGSVTAAAVPAGPDPPRCSSDCSAARQPHKPRLGCSASHELAGRGATARVGCAEAAAMLCVVSTETQSGPVGLLPLCHGRRVSRTSRNLALLASFFALRSSISPAAPSIPPRVQLEKHARDVGWPSRPHG
jgi:hypothetical protein